MEPTEIGICQAEGFCNAKSTFIVQKVEVCKGHTPMLLLRKIRELLSNSDASDDERVYLEIGLSKSFRRIQKSKSP